MYWTNSACLARVISERGGLDWTGTIEGISGQVKEDGGRNNRFRDFAKASSDLYSDFLGLSTPMSKVGHSPFVDLLGEVGGQ